MQLRAKTLSFGAFADLAGDMSVLCRAADAVLIINDRADVAAISGAAGVHVGQDDLSVADARRVVGPTGIVGFSTHTDQQVREGVRQPVSYLAIGPVFETSTKTTGYEAIGLEGVRSASQCVRPTGVPLVAIGGITRDRAADVLAAGADVVAVISDLLPPSSSDLGRRAEAWLRLSRARL